MSEMFSGCSRLTDLDLSRFDTGKVKVQKGMFRGCSSLTHLALNRFNIDNENEIFEGCSSQPDIDWGEDED
jgi:surface protein